MKKTHDIKCETEYYQARERGEKTFEVRVNDRNYEVGDKVILHEVVKGIATGRQINNLTIKYIFHGGIYGLDEDYCIFNC